MGTEDCSQLANRQMSATSVCWPVAQFAASLVNPYPLYVRVRDIVSGAFTTTHPVTYAASGVAGSDDGVCRSQVQTGPTALVLYVFFADAEGNPYNNVQTYNLSVDMLAGDVQGNVSIGIGDTLLIVNVPPTTDPDTQGYNVYCDPPPDRRRHRRPFQLTPRRTMASARPCSRTEVRLTTVTRRLTAATRESPRETTQAGTSAASRSTTRGSRRPADARLPRCS